MLTIRLLGPVSLSHNGQPMRLANRKAQAIVAYLALNDLPAERRARLAGLLWSEYGQNNALTSLRQTLLELRRAMQDVGCPALATTHSHVVLDRTQLRVDLTDIIAAVTIGEVPDSLLRQAHVSETLLDGFDDLDPAFRDWLVGQRHVFHQRLSLAMAKRLADTSVPPSAHRPLAQAALLLDPTNEEACRLVMLDAAQQGETAAALRAYDELYRVLDIEHDMEPSQETQALLARIKLGEFDPRPGTEAIVSRGSDIVPDAHRPPRLAVLPFRIVGLNQVPPYFMDGLVEDIVCSLAGLREPEVVSSNSTRAMREGEIDLYSIGAALDVRYIVSGLLRPFGDRLRLSVELAEAATGTVLWKHNHDTEEARLFDVHDTIVANVVNLLAPRVHQAELQRIRRVRPDNLSAYHRMLQARELIFELKEGSFDRAGDLLREAIALDPAYANSHVTLAHWCSLRLGQGWSPDRAADALELDAAARTALRLDPGNAHAMVLLGHNRTLLEHDYAEALSLFEQALRVAPNDATVWTLSSPTFAFIGNANEAIRRGERALSLSPRDPFAFRIYHFLSLAHFFGGFYDQAEVWGREALRANPNYTSNLRLLACVLVQRDKLAEARGLAARAMQIQPGFRVGPAVARLASRDEKARAIYANNLLAAGIPA
jgi:DNA-binding SARP family transcriptional activator/Tfp pilus assembly protein PilF